MGYHPLVAWSLPLADLRNLRLTNWFPKTSSAIQPMGTPSAFCTNQIVPGFVVYYLNYIEEEFLSRTGILKQNRNTHKVRTGKAILAKPTPQLFSAFAWVRPRTTDARWGNCLQCTNKNQIQIRNLQLRLQHILSAKSARFFRFLWLMPSLGVRNLWVRLMWHYQIPTDNHISLGEIHVGIIDTKVAVTVVTQSRQSKLI